MPADHLADRDRITRPRVIVSVTATADGRVTLSRGERLLDDGPSQRWKAAWPPDAGDLLARRAAAIEQRHHPTVVLEGSGTFVADDAGPADLPGTSVPAEVLRTDFLPFWRRRWRRSGCSSERSAWHHLGALRGRSRASGTVRPCPLAACRKTYISLKRSMVVPSSTGCASRP
jgi:hypothetical protein